MTVRRVTDSVTSPARDRVRAGTPGPVRAWRLRARPDLAAVTQTPSQQLAGRVPSTRAAIPARALAVIKLTRTPQGLRPPGTRDRTALRNRAGGAGRPGRGRTVTV
jgi:hypothetical protein